MFKDRADYVGEEILTLGAGGAFVGLNPPSGAAFARIWYNSAGAAATGANTVSMYYGTDPTNLIRFTDTGGFIEILGPTDLAQFRAASTSGADETLQVFYHLNPWF